jgi:cyanophycin synthetase
MESKDNKPVAVHYSMGLEQQWTVLNGMAYGLTQPTLYGVIHTNVGCLAVFETLNTVIQQWLDINITPAIENQSSAHSLITNLLTWQSRLQQQHQVPVFEKFAIHAMPSNISNEKRYLVALPYIVPDLTRELLSWFVFVVNYFLANINELSTCSPQELKQYLAEADKHLQRLREQLVRYQLSGMNTYLFVRAADKLAIPVTHVALNAFRFGTGKHSHLLDSSFTENTSVIGSKISKSKSNTAIVLRNAGLPSPINFNVFTEEQVAGYCDKMGFPLVIKPDNLDQGKGVYAHLLTKKQVIKAYRAAIKLSDKILIEKHVMGDDFRITVFNNRVIKVLKRTAAGVIGDGKLNVSQLVKIAQQSEFLQAVFRQTKQMKLSLDDEALDLLKEQALNKQTIPHAGRYVTLRRKSNMSTGGTVSLIEACDVHPDNLSLAIRTAQVVNLDLAGIDLLIPDISKSWLESDAIICEVNAQPQVGITGTPHIHEEILSILLNEKKGIPLHLVIYPTEAHCIEPIQIETMLQKHQCNALTMKQGIWIDKVKISKDFVNSFVAIKALIHHRDVGSALCIMSQQEVINIGLPLAHFTTIDVYSTELFRTKAMINFVGKIKDHTDKLELHNIKAENALQ